MAFTTQGEVRGLRYLPEGSPIPIRYLLGRHRLVEGYHYPSSSFGVSSFGIASMGHLHSENKALGLKSGRVKAAGRYLTIPFSASFSVLPFLSSSRLPARRFFSTFHESYTLRMSYQALQKRS